MPATNNALYPFLAELLKGTTSKLLEKPGMLSFSKGVPKVVAGGQM